MRPIVILALALLPAVASPTRTYTPAELAQQALRSTVRVTMDAPKDKNGQPQTHVCAGFVVDAAKGWVLTAAHCVPSDDKPVAVDDKTSFVVAVDQHFAVVKTLPMGHAPLELAKNVPPLGAQVTAVGFGMETPTVIVRTVMAHQGGDIYLDGYLMPGMSGGAAFDEQGRVVGILQAIWWVPAGRDPLSVGVVCGVEEIRAFLKQAERGRQ